MTPLRVNAPVEQATQVLERYARLDGERAAIDARRDTLIVMANQMADAKVLPIASEMAVLAEQLQRWWERNGAGLTKGKRKSAELGGCMIGSRTAKARLAFAGGDDKAALAALQPHKWAKPYVRVSFAVDKTATATALTGKAHGAKLAELGFSLAAPVETFFVDRVAQDGVVGA